MSARHRSGAPPLTITIVCNTREVIGAELCSSRIRNNRERTVIRSTELSVPARGIGPKSFGVFVAYLGREVAGTIPPPATRPVITPDETPVREIDSKPKLLCSLSLISCVCIMSVDPAANRNDRARTLCPRNSSVFSIARCRTLMGTRISTWR